MHHITSEILTFHLSPTLSELRWRVWRWMAKPSHVQWLCSLPSVAWDDFARTQPAHSPSQHARKRAASPRGNRWLRPIPWFCQRATVGRRSSPATDEAISALSWYRCDMRSRGFWHKYQNLASCYFDKVLLKQKVRMSFLMCFMFYQHKIFLMLQTLCLKIRISVQNYEFLAFWILISAFKGWQLWTCSSDFKKWKQCYCIRHIFRESNFSRIGTLRHFREWLNSRSRRAMYCVHKSHSCVGIGGKYFRVLINSRIAPDSRNSRK